MCNLLEIAFVFTLFGVGIWLSVSSCIFILLSASSLLTHELPLFSFYEPRMPAFSLFFLLAANYVSVISFCDFNGAIYDRELGDCDLRIAILITIMTTILWIVT